MSTLPMVGVDVSKATLDVQLGSHKHKGLHLQVSNDQQGFEHMETWLLDQGHPQVHVCLEATGTYSDAVACYLHARGHQVSLIPPSRMKAFRESEGLLNKSDRLDAWLLARYGEQKQPGLWHPIRPCFQQLKQDLARYDDLKGMAQQEKNRLENQRLDTESREQIQEHIHWLEQRAKDWVRRAYERFVQAWQQEQEQSQAQSGARSEVDALAMLAAIDAIKGFDRLSSLRVLALMGSLQEPGHAGQVASYCGLVPGIWTSGTSVQGKPGIRHTGSAAPVRRWLFLCALTCKRLDPDMAQWARELEGRGKKKMVIIVAVMRKLIHIFCGMFKSGRPYDPRKAFPSHYAKEEDVPALQSA